MTDGHLRQAVRHLRRLIGPRAADALPDGQLVQRFAAQRDEAAFEALVGRHGPMVLGVCRRLLRDGHDAEDAFQATFLVLARKAGTLRQGALVGNWLYGVAYRIAVRARAYAARRPLPGPVPDVPAPEPAHEMDAQELRAVIDEELHRLPEKYRAPVVLCYLEGKTHEEAAQELGWPRGTVATRLTRARERLRARLARRGLAPADSLLPAALAAEAAVPAALASATIRAAPLVLAGHPLGAVSAPVAELMKGALRDMYLSKLTLLAVIVLAAGAIGAGVLVYRARTSTPHDPANPPTPQASTRAPDDKPDPPPEPVLPPAEVRVVQPGDRLRIEALGLIPGQPISGTYRVEPSGKIPLGPRYGKVDVRSLTIEEVETTIERHLAKIVKEPRVQATWADRPPQPGPRPPDQPPERIQPGTALLIWGPGALTNDPMDRIYTVEPSGKVPLGPGYGRVHLAGLTLDEAEEAIRNHLAKFLEDPGAFVTLPGAIPSSGSQREPALEQQLQQLTNEVRELRAAVEALRATQRK